MNPTSAGFAEVNRTSLYHEVYGDGPALVLIHGGLTTIGEMHGWVEPLAQQRRVIAVEMQGHGHTPDTDRPLSFDTLADDIAALLDHLDVRDADIAGHSFGGDVALRTAIRHPHRVRRLVVVSATYARSGWYPEAQAGMAAVDGSLADNLMRTPTGELSRQWPEPGRFPRFLDKLGKLMGEPFDLSAQVAALPMPVLLVFADNDSLPQRHIADFFALLGGGIKEPGWIDTQLSASRLAVVPGYSHYNFISSPEVPQLVAKFLDDPLTNAPSGAAAASQVTAD